MAGCNLSGGGGFYFWVVTKTEGVMKTAYYLFTFLLPLFLVANIYFPMPKTLVVVWICVAFVNFWVFVIVVSDSYSYGSRPGWIITSYLALISGCFLLTVVSNQTGNYDIYQENGQWGLRNRYLRNVPLAPVYDTIIPRSVISEVWREGEEIRSEQDTLFLVRTGHNWGAGNVRGLIAQPVYDSIVIAVKSYRPDAFFNVLQCYRAGRVTIVDYHGDAPSDSLPKRYPPIDPEYSPY